MEDFQKRKMPSQDEFMGEVGFLPFTFSDERERSKELIYRTIFLEKAPC
jgi:hypothetical protein